MDLSFLIPSKARRTILQYFCESPGAEMGVRELARALNLSPQVAHRELVNLEGWGILFSSAKGIQRSFRLNKSYPLYPVIQSLFDVCKREQERKYEIVGHYKLNQMVAKAKKVPVPSRFIKGLTAKRRKPRAWVEGILLDHED